MVQLELIPTTITEESTTTFINNMKLPIHRWFRFSAGYSAQWVQHEIIKFREELNQPVVIFDPFAGVGTTLLAGDMCGIRSYGVEAQPFLSRITQAKLGWGADIEKFLDFSNSVYRQAKHSNGDTGDYPTLIKKCFPDDTLAILDNLKKAWSKHNDGSVYSELTWLTITSILRVSSPVGTSQMELIQPKKSKKNFMHPLEAYQSQVQLMAQDMEIFQSQTPKSDSNALLYKGDMRNFSEMPKASINLVITSPPYANNFDYADATRFEMSFWGQIDKWSDLHRIRQNLVISCSHHAQAAGVNMQEVLQSKELNPIQEEIIEVCYKLAEERELHGGKKNYHLMVAGYFFDMVKVLSILRKICTKDAKLCFVVGDSAPYGIYVPVDEWLGRLALNVGFTGYYFEKTRDRNVKWRNRKHRVPLHEGRLWIRG
ncbi:MAG: DNA modification methylase [Anaerolineae bacterium]|nr:DNA modification methylase [Anaerolineae bacterium]